jgi:hypothetical protein
VKYFNTILLLAILICISSCGKRPHCIKYPGNAQEDCVTTFDRLTGFDRGTSKTWILDSVLYNGSNVTAYYNNFYGEVSVVFEMNPRFPTGKPAFYVAISSTKGPSIVLSSSFEPGLTNNFVMTRWIYPLPQGETYTSTYGIIFGFYYPFMQRTTRNIWNIHALTSTQMILTHYATDTTIHNYFSLH